MQQNRERGYHRRSQPFYVRGPVLICKLYLGSLLQFIIQIKSKDLLFEIAVDLFLQSLNFSILGLKNQHSTCSKRTFCEVSIFFHIGKQVVAHPNCYSGPPELLLWSTRIASVAHPNCYCGPPAENHWVIKYLPQTFLKPEANMGRDGQIRIVWSWSSLNSLNGLVLKIYVS